MSDPQNGAASAQEGHGAFTMVRRSPPADLSPWVLGLEGFEERTGVVSVQRQVPTGFVPLIIVFGPGFAQHDADTGELRRELEHSFLAGVHQHAALVGSRGRSLCMQVNFTPVGAWRFLGVDMHELADSLFDLSDLIGAEAPRLEMRLAEANSWEARLDLVEGMLRERLARALIPNPLVGEALRWMYAHPESIRVDALVRHLGCSRKHLASLFKREVGITPKALGRILRFDAVVQGLANQRFATLADAALACGYADQAHFNRDCRQLSGLTPSGLLDQANPWS